MRCPHCAAEKCGVLDSRDADEGRATRRRRVCNTCDKRFTTYERIEETPLWVVKKDGHRETFDRQKFISGIFRATQKRPVSTEAIENAANQIERDAHRLFTREVESTWLGEQIMNFLREADQVAYVRFASVYRSFRDVSEFREAAEALEQERSPTSS